MNINEHNDVDNEQEAVNIQERMFNTSLISHLSVASEMDFDQAPAPPPIIKKLSTYVPNNYYNEPPGDIMQQLVRQPSFLYNPFAVGQVNPFKTNRQNDIEPYIYYDNNQTIAPGQTILQDYTEQVSKQAKQLQDDEILNSQNSEIKRDQTKPIEKQEVQNSDSHKSSKSEDQSSQGIKYRIKQISRSRSRSEVKQKPQKNSTFIPCTCTKTHCLKMYCSCFHNGQRCISECKCEECKNVSDYEEDINDAIQHVKLKAHRTHQPNEDDLFNTQQVWGCNCKKTHCLKRYCECFIRSKKCTEKCNCHNCENGRDEDLEPYNNSDMYKESPRRKRRRKPQSRKISNDKSVKSVKR